MYFDIVLIKKEGTDGLTRNEIIDLFDMSSNLEVYPIEIEGWNSVTMGFITPESAELLDYDYKESGLNDFIADILDDINNETEDCCYEFKGIKIWLSR